MFRRLSLLKATNRESIQQEQDKRFDMKKIWITCGLVTSLFFTCLAQFTPTGRDISKFKRIDNAKIQVTYSLDFKYDPQGREYHKDVRIIQVGDIIVKDYSGIMHNNDSIVTILKKKGQPSPMLQKIIYPYEIFNNYEKEKCMITYRTFLNGPILRYVEEQPKFIWSLKDVAEEILGYQCKMATTHFAGREYRAWYTTKVPVNAGPYKFNGLPGLILKVEDSERFFIWTAIGISKVKEPVLEYELEEGYKKCTRTQADETIKRMFSSPFTFHNSLGGKIMIKGKDGCYERGTAKNESSIPYEPLEK